jgi:multiple sugar transport system substrate-binding protein
MALPAPSTRRSFLLGGAGLLATPLAGCSLRPPSAADPIPATPIPNIVPQLQEPISLSLLGWPYRQDLLETILDRFRQLNPDVRVEFNELLNDYGPHAQSIILGGEPANVVLAREGQAGLWWSNRMLRPLSGISTFDDMAARLFPSARRAVEVDRDLVGLPFYTDAIMLASNQSMLAAVGAAPPETWDQLLATSVAIRDRGLSRWPLSLNFGPKVNANLPWWAMVYAAGGSLREPADGLRDADPAEPAPRLLRMLRSFLVDDLILNPDFGETSYSAILDGGPAFSLVGGYFARFAADEFNNHRAPRINFSPVPGLDAPGVSTAGWTPFYSVPAATADVEMSTLLALHLGGIDGTGDFFAPKSWALNEGLPPAYPDVLNDPEVNAQFQSWLDPDLLNDVLTVAKPVQALWEPWFATWEHWMQDELQSALWGRKTALAAVDSINRYAHGLSGQAALED